MNKRILILLVVVSSKLVLVASQNSAYCYGNWQCSNGGCCADSECHPKSSWRCQKSCYDNWQCDSRCCKYNQCQDSYESCDRTEEYDTTVTPAPSRCSYDCSYYGHCCIDGECQSCSQTTTFSWLETTQAPKCYDSYDCSYYGECCVYGVCQPCSYQTTKGYNGDSNDDYYDYDDEYDRRSDNSSSGLGVGPVIGIAVAAIFVMTLTLSLLGCYYGRRRQGMIVVRRHIACLRVPLIENDQLQLEHERGERQIPARLPPAYSPRPFQDNTPEGPPPLYTPTPTNNSNTTTESAQAHGARDNTAHVNGVQPGATTVPPPAYQTNYEANADQNANAAQNTNVAQNTNAAQNTNTAQTPAAAAGGITGNAEQVNGVPQGSSGVPPSTNITSPPPNTMGPFLI